MRSSSAAWPAIVVLDAWRDYLRFLRTFPKCCVFPLLQARVAGGAEVEAAVGPVRMEPGAPHNALVLRKPDLRIDSDWALEFFQ